VCFALLAAASGIAIAKSRRAAQTEAELAEVPIAA
jgi:hypothetical protein